MTAESRLQLGESINPYGRFSTVPVPKWLTKWQGPDAPSTGATLLYGWLLWHNRRNGDCHPSHAALAEELGGISLRRVRSYLRELKDAGLIRVKQGGDGKPARYFFLLHARMLPELDSARSDSAGLEGSARSDSVVSPDEKRHSARSDVTGGSTKGRTTEEPPPPAVCNGGGDCDGTGVVLLDSRNEMAPCPACR